MPEGRLYIGNRRYSSWSMRGWLAVKLAALDVEEVQIHFTRPGPTGAIAGVSPNGLVPYLEHRDVRVWESLAVCEYCAEVMPSLWPALPAALSRYQTPKQKATGTQYRLAQSACALGGPPTTRETRQRISIGDFIQRPY